MNAKADIDAELDRLQDRLRALLAERPRDEVLDAFAREAQPLIERSSAEHAAYIQDRIHDMLVDAGAIEDDSPTG